MSKHFDQSKSDDGSEEDAKQPSMLPPLTSADLTTVSDDANEDSNYVEKEPKNPPAPFTVADDKDSFKTPKSPAKRLNREQLMLNVLGRIERAKKKGERAEVARKPAISDSCKIPKPSTKRLDREQLMLNVLGRIERRKKKGDRAEVARKPTISASIEDIESSEEMRPGAIAVDGVDAGTRLVSSWDSNYHASFVVNDVEDKDSATNDSKGKDIVVAHPIEEEESLSLPAALEYQPVPNPPIYKNPRFLQCGFLFVLLFVGTVVGAVFGILKRQDSRTAGIDAKIKALAGEEAEDESTPAGRARNWILDVDPLRLTDSSPNLDQRYLLALFYFATTGNGDDTWLSCGKPDDPNDSSCTYLELQLTDHTYIPVEDQVRWLSIAFECEWNGVLCDDNDEIIQLDLFAQNMTGTLPSELANLSTLTWIGLAFNEFTGKIPSELADLRRLILIDLHYNMFSGSIPSQIWNMDNLQSLNVGSNLGMTGTIPTSVGRLNTLKGLRLFDNNFDGSIPTEIGMLTHLAFSRLDTNAFDGAIPTEYGMLTRLQRLDLDHNYFKGTIPSEMGLLTDLVDLRLGPNGIDGTIPDELYNLKELEFLKIEHTDVSGELSTKVGQLTALRLLSLRGNQLEGTIPTEVGLMRILLLGHFHLNLFTGSMPQEICDISFLDPKYLQTDCFGNPPSVICEPSCCENCCDRASRVCLSQDG